MRRHTTFLGGGIRGLGNTTERVCVIKSKGVTKELVTGVWPCGASAVKSGAGTLLGRRSCGGGIESWGTLYLFIPF